MHVLEPLYILQVPKIETVIAWENKQGDSAGPYRNLW